MKLPLTLRASVTAFSATGTETAPFRLQEGLGATAVWPTQGGARADILRLRARRFHALHGLLIGCARSAKPAYHRLSDHLLRDIGMPQRDPNALPASRRLVSFGVYRIGSADEDGQISR